jgi:GGDEF domain-containing protein
MSHQTEPAALIALRAEILRLQTELEERDHDPAFGCLKREAIERRATPTSGHALVFIDLDGVHAINARTGSYERVDSLVRAALADLACRDSDILAGRWQSGDELVFVVPQTDADGFLVRLAEMFGAHELTFTGAHTPMTGMFANDVKTAAAKVLAQKHARDQKRNAPWKLWIIRHLLHMETSRLAD